MVQTDVQQVGGDTVHLATGAVTTSQAESSTGTQAQTVEVHPSGMSERELAVQKKMSEQDPIGIGVTIIAMVVVLSALFILNLLFRGVGKIQVWRTNRAAKAAEGKSGTGAPARSQNESEVAVAIALALHQHLQAARDQESLYITIREVEKRYTPWNSKIYGVMQGRMWSQMRFRQR